MSRKLVGKWFERGVEVGKTDGWMTVEDTIAEILERGQPQDAQDLVWRAIEEWEETDHFSIFYGSKMMEDARRDPDLYSEMKAEFWEGYLTGRKEIGVDIYKIAKALLPSGESRETERAWVQKKLPLTNLGEKCLVWRTTVQGKTYEVEVCDIRGLTTPELGSAFAASTAEISAPYEKGEPERELPFAAAEEGKVWWLATIKNRTHQVEVSGIRHLTERQLEDAFANSTAFVSIFHKIK
ncbi:MAG: hypothetical protein DDT26_02535 [Dehalococcoidia bacterium]|nr:hypothetical protein [Chloroflexota bacterium]